MTTEVDGVAIQPGGQGWGHGFGHPPNGLATNPPDGCACMVNVIWNGAAGAEEQPGGHEAPTHALGHEIVALIGVIVVTGQPDGQF